MRCLIAALLAAVMLSAPGCGTSGTPRAHIATRRLSAECAGKPIHVTVLGDSLARGWGAHDSRNSFASRVHTFIMRRRPRSTIINFGIPGATSDQIASREVPHILPVKCALILVVAGANDVQKYYTPAHFDRSYDALLRDIRGRVPKAAIVVTGLPDISLSPRIPKLTKFVISELSRKANDSIADAAARYGAASVDFYSLSRREASHETQFLSSDGIHPNDAGYKLMAESTFPAISKLTRI